MSKTPVSTVVTLTGSSGTVSLPIDFSDTVAGIMFASATVTAGSNWGISLSLVPVDPTTSVAVPVGATGCVPAVSLSGNAGTSTVEWAAPLTGVYAATYELAWSSGLVLSAQDVTITFVPAPGAVSVTING